MIAARIQVDPTLPPAQFNAELLAATRLARIEANLRRRRVKVTEAAFERLGYDSEAAQELAEIHVHGVAP